jgi:uncharacterized protein YbjQ (UPF0145 family)
MNQLTKWIAFLFSTVACSTLLFGCATGTVLKWTGQSEFEGKGGAFQAINGIDFYMSGEPAGRYKVLSIMQGGYYRGGSFLMSSLSKQKAIDLIVKEAKAEGADAVVMISTQYQILGSSTSGMGNISPQGTFVYSSGTSVNGEQTGSVALLKYIDIKH